MSLLGSCSQSSLWRCLYLHHCWRVARGTKDQVQSFPLPLHWPEQVHMITPKCSRRLLLQGGGTAPESSETRATKSFWTTISKGHIFSLVSAQEELLSQRISSGIRAAVQGVKVGPGSKADGGSGPGVRHRGRDRQRPSSTAFTLSQADLFKSLAVQSRAGNQKLALFP